MTEILAIIAVLIIAVLSVIASVLHWRLYRLRKVQAVAEAEARAKREAQQQDINRSIQVLARALQAEQVGATEASIRISVLMDALGVDEAVKKEFTAFYKLAEEAAHIPILDAWKALPRDKRRAYERELVALEDKYQDFIADASLRIQGREL